MIQVKGISIFADVEDIVQRIRVASGNKYFDKIVRSGTNIQTQCPFHKGGQERKPSFGISEDGKCHCFTCGKSCHISQLVSYVLGVNGVNWLLENYVSYDVEKREKLEFEFNRYDSKQENKPVIFNTIYHPYFKKRGISEAIAKEFECGYDSKNEAVTFVIRDFNGNAIGVCTRSINSKYFYIPSGMSKPVVYANRFSSGEFSTCVICESIFNALTCWQYGYPAVALLGTGDTEQYEILNKMPVRKFILALDPDSAGDRGREKLRQAIKGKIITEWIVPKGKDINDLGESVKKLKEIF